VGGEHPQRFASVGSNLSQAPTGVSHLPLKSTYLVFSSTYLKQQSFRKEPLIKKKKGAKLLIMKEKQLPIKIHKLEALLRRLSENHPNRERI